MSVAARAAGVAIKATPAGRVASAAGGKDPRKSAPGSKAAQQREAIEGIKAKRQPEDQADEHDEHEDQADEHAGKSSSGVAGMEGPATGGGFLLGLMVWAVARAYIGNPGQPSGVDGVKRLLRAKFLNKTS